MILNGTISRGRVYHILRNGTSRIRIQASRLVAIAYISNPDNKPFVCHKDNNPLNNRVENLYWGTQLENIRQCISDKRLRPQGKIPLTKSQIKSLNQDYTSGVKVRLIEKKYNITHIHRYLYSNIKLRRNVDKRTLDKL